MKQKKKLMKLSLRISWLQRIFHLRNWVNMLIKVEMLREKMKLQKMMLEKTKPQTPKQQLLKKTTVVTLQEKLRTKEKQLPNEG